MPEELRIVPRARPMSSPPLRDVVAVVFRHGRLTLISFAAIFLAVLLYGLIAPPYESEMKVLLRKGRVDPAMTSTPSQAEFERQAITEEELNSEVELLHDNEILRTVVEKSGLMSEGDSWWHWIKATPDERLERAVRRLNRRLTVEPLRKTTLISVTYSSSNQERGTKLLQALAAAYLQRHEVVHRPSGELNFFEQQVTLSQRSLQEAELQLMNFSEDEGVISAATERDTALQKLAEAEADDQQTQVALSTTAERIRTLQSKLQALPERIVTQVRNSDNPQLMEKMKGRLLELQLQRADLVAKYEPTYRSVQDVDREIAETQGLIAAENQAPIREQTSDQEPNHEWVKSELVKAQVELSALNAHSVAERRLLAHYRETSHQLGDRAVEQERLIHDLRAAEDKYLLYVNKREEARIGDALDQGGILNVTIAEKPTVPPLPKYSAWIYGLFGFLSAGTVSLGLAFVTDYLSPAFRTPDEVMAYLESPVLASLPHKG